MCGVDAALGDGGTPVVLIVDDEQDIACELVEFLSLEGCRARFETDPLAALAALRADPSVTVLVTDIRMPGMTGKELARGAVAGRAEGEAIGVILMTGHAERAADLQDVRPELLAFFRKPVNPEELLSMVGRLHARVRSARAGAAGG